MTRISRALAALSISALTVTALPLALAAPAHATPDECISYLAEHGYEGSKFVSACNVSVGNIYACIAMIDDIPQEFYTLACVFGADSEVEPLPR